MSHAYTPDPQSTAGNCTCGRSREHRAHPHEYRRASNEAIVLAGDLVCVCGRRPEAEPHLESLNPNAPGEKKP